MTDDFVPLRMPMLTWVQATENGQPPNIPSPVNGMACLDLRPDPTGVRAGTNWMWLYRDGWKNFEISHFNHHPKKDDDMTRPHETPPDGDHDVEAELSDTYRHLFDEMNEALGALEDAIQTKLRAERRYEEAQGRYRGLRQKWSEAYVDLRIHKEQNRKPT